MEKTRGEKGEVLLSVRELSCTFRGTSGASRALDGVSFDIMRSEIFGLVGESGSGKTTTGRIISGIYEPSGGTVSYLGEVIRAGCDEPKAAIRAAKSDARRRIIKLVGESLRHPKRSDLTQESIDSVNSELQKILKTEREKLDFAMSVRRKHGKRSHPGIRMVFQDPSASLNPRMTVGEAVGEALIAIGERDGRTVEKKVREALSAVGLPASAMARYPHEFSGGQKQRVGIARAIITRPELLIADEPISALDVSVGAQVVNLLRELAREMSLSVLFIAHDLSVVRSVCDRVGVMNKGRLVELAPTEELFTNTLHPYTKALLSAIPIPDPTVAKASRREMYLADEENADSDFCDVGDGHYVRCRRGS